MRGHGGVIINIASVGGMPVEPSIGIYNVTKAALIHLTRRWPPSWARPGSMHVARPGEDRLRPGARRDGGKELVAEAADAAPGRARDIANIALFLASDAASWITGQTFVVDGGAPASEASPD